MMRIVLAIALLLPVMACGVDGEPVQPTANVGVHVSNSGVRPMGSVHVNKGPITYTVAVGDYWDW